jgi:xanthine dehydrogenase small subunit
VTFGACVTHAAALPHLAAIDPDLGEMMRRFASRQVRNMGTIGGNIRKRFTDRGIRRRP